MVLDLASCGHCVSIGHTPRNEELELTIGQAFDIVAEETIVDRRSITNRVKEFDYKISLRNRKEESVTIHVQKRLGGDWKILQTSHKYDKKSADQIQFDIEVPADREAKLLFTVRAGA